MAASTASMSASRFARTRAALLCACLAQLADNIREASGSRTKRPRSAKRSAKR